MTKRTSNSPSVHLNLNVRGLSQSATLRINDRSNQMLREGRQVYKLGLGQSPFPVPQLVVDQLKANAYQKDYLPVTGLRELCGAVADYIDRTQAVNFSPDGVMIGPGSKELMFLLQLVYYGDLVIPTPSWVSYAPQAHIIGRHIRWVPTKREDGWRMMPAELEKLCSADPERPRLLIINYPGNPSGSTYNTEELKALAKVARKYKVVVLSDEIYGELHHSGEHVSLARFYPEGTVISSGLSKWCGAGGWRLGLFAFPRSLRWLQDAMAAAASETYTSTSTPIQYAAVSAFAGGMEIEQYLRDCRRILAALGNDLAGKMRRAGSVLQDPQGAFYLFPDFTPLRDGLAKRGIQTSGDFCEQLLESTGVAALPGSDFGRPAEELTARLAYVDFDGARVLAAAGQKSEAILDEEFLSRYCFNCVKAVDLLCEWLNS